MLLLRTSLFLVLILTHPVRSGACACCAERGTRITDERSLDAYSRSLLQSLKPAPVAHLYLTDAGDDGVQGLRNIQDTYRVRTTLGTGRWTWTFAGSASAAGALTLAMPARYQIFAIDTAPEDSTGGMVTLYKEWRISGAAAISGALFLPAKKDALRYELVLGGWGNIVRRGLQLQELAAGNMGSRRILCLVRKAGIGKRHHPASPVLPGLVLLASSENHPHHFPHHHTMKTFLLSATLLLATTTTHAQFGGLKVNDKVVSAGEKGLKAATFSDADAARLAGEAVGWMDEHNPVAGPKDPYAVRLVKLFGKHQKEDGLSLNYKVYMVKDINAFACADGSVRVFSSLMDMMTDDELLAVIGHEIGHVKNKDTRDAVRSAYKRAAITDAASSQGGAVASLTQSQLGDFAEALLNSSYSRKQETEADIYSYNFMKKHGYDVMAEAAAFRKLASLGGSGKQSGMEKMMNSHPDAAKRADDVEKRAKKDGLAK